tara:strand:+ start:178 stop:282 length:105 start_codon:yes stop_codon:yes gene_type:complete
VDILVKEVKEEMEELLISMVQVQFLEQEEQVLLK